MPEYRRYFVPGGTYFFTVVSYGRRPILADPVAREALRKAIEKARAQWPFDLVAIVLLPEHLHTIWTLPSGDADYSLRWQKIKERFTRRYLAAGGQEGRRRNSLLRRRQRAIWQERFWEHTCFDEDDVKAHLDYIHWNPVKHGLVSRVVDYPWSTFRRFATLGEYDLDWGGQNPCPDLDVPET